MVAPKKQVDKRLDHIVSLLPSSPSSPERAFESGRTNGAMPILRFAIVPWDQKASPTRPKRPNSELLPKGGRLQAET
jgi:hypothetical protein